MSQLIRSRNDANLDCGIRAVFVNVRELITDHAAIVHRGQQVSGGVLPMLVAATFPAAKASATHRWDAKGILRGRNILDFDGPEDSRRRTPLLIPPASRQAWGALSLQCRSLPPKHG